MLPMDHEDRALDTVREAGRLHAFVEVAVDLRIAQPVDEHLVSSRCIESKSPEHLKEIRDGTKCDYQFTAGTGTFVSGR